MKKTLPDYLQDDFNGIYKCNIEAEDIISRTDFFNEPAVVETEVLLCDNIQGQLGSALGAVTVLQEQVLNAQEAPAYIASNKNEIPLFIEETIDVETKRKESVKPRNKLTFYQRAFHSSVIFASSLIIVVFVLTMGVISLNNKKDQWNSKNDNLIINTTLNDEEKTYISSKVTRIYDESVYESYICDNTKLSLYKGTNYVDHEKASNVYFYKLVSSNKESHKLTIKCNENTINISSNNSFGILTVIETELSTSFDSFIIEVIDQNGSSRSYQINIPSKL